MSQGSQLSNPVLSLVRSDSWSEGLASRDYHALINQDINYLWLSQVEAVPAPRPHWRWTAAGGQEQEQGSIPGEEGEPGSPAGGDMASSQGAAAGRPF